MFREMAATVVGFVVVSLSLIAIGAVGYVLYTLTGDPAEAALLGMIGLLFLMVSYGIGAIILEETSLGWKIDDWIGR